MNSRRRPRPTRRAPALPSAAPRAPAASIEDAEPQGLREDALARAATPAQRATAALSMQRALGNVAVQRAIQRDDAPPQADPARAEEQQRQRQAQESAEAPAGERVAGAAKDVLLHYASEHLRSLGDEALRQLARAWRESPGGTIAAGTILGAAGVSYLVGTKTPLPAITIPLDFLAGRAPLFRGAEVTLRLGGPITSPESFSFSLTLREQAPGGERSRRGSGGGRPFTPRMTLRQDGVSAAGPESGAELLVQGRIPIPRDAARADIAATIDAIEGGNVDVEVASMPAMRVSVLSVEDSFKPDRYGLNAPPIDRHLLVRLRTAIPPLFHQGPETIDLRSVRVRINNTSSEGSAQVRVRLLPLPH